MLHRCFKGDKVVRPASGTYASSRCRDDLMVARPDFPSSFVGIFWAIQEQGAAVSIEDHRCSLKEAEPYGTMLTRLWDSSTVSGGRIVRWTRGDDSLSQRDKPTNVMLSNNRPTSFFIAIAIFVASTNRKELVEFNLQLKPERFAFSIHGPERPRKSFVRLTRRSALCRTCSGVQFLWRSS
jgi:hypothetical protein